MTIEERAAELYEIVTHAGFRCLLIGGHAVRYYGFDRRTVDFDFQLAVDVAGWPDLARHLSAAPGLSSVREGESWRPDDFRRFVTGALPDGRDERIEFWRRNHLLPPFQEAWSRREQGRYGGGDLAFLGLDDLIRSKETERDDDWSDVRVLEELRDERDLAKAIDADSTVAAVARLRSRRGFETVVARRLLEDRAVVSRAAVTATHPITRAYLAPYMGWESMPDDVLARALATAIPASAKHLALVEAVRNRYRMAAAAADRADKEASRTRVSDH